MVIHKSFLVLLFLSIKRMKALSTTRLCGLFNLFCGLKQKVYFVNGVMLSTHTFDVSGLKLSVVHMIGIRSFSVVKTVMEYK